jgi:hypothetical protein
MWSGTSSSAVTAFSHAALGSAGCRRRIGEYQFANPDNQNLSDDNDARSRMNNSYFFGHLRGRNSAGDSIRVG